MDSAEAAGPFDPGAEPAADVAPAGDGGEVVHVAEEVEVRQPLEHAEVEGGAPNPLAGEREPEQLAPFRRDARPLELSVGSRAAQLILRVALAP